MLYTVIKTVTVEINATSSSEALELFANPQNWIGQEPPQYEVYFHNEETNEVIQEV